MATFSEQLEQIYKQNNQANDTAGKNYWTEYEKQHGAAQALAAMNAGFDTAKKKTNWDTFQKDTYSKKGQELDTKSDSYWDDYYNTHGEEQAKNAMLAGFTNDRKKSHEAAYQNALKNANNNSIWGQFGIDANIAKEYGLTDTYQSYIKDMYDNMDLESLVPEDAYSTKYVKPLLTDAIAGANQKYTTDLYNQFTQQYGPNYAMTAISDDWDDQYITDYLTGQKQDALSTLEMAKNRGQLNDVGYNKALAELGNQESKGRSLLQSIGSGVLGGYRNNVNSYLANQASSLGSYKLGQNFDIGSISGQLNKMLGDYKGRLQGDLLAGAGDTSYFDTLGLIKKGGSMQGIMNNPTTGVTPDLLGTFSDEEQRKRNNLTTTGNQAF